MKDNFLLKKYQKDVFDVLSDEDAGKLIKGVFNYVSSGDSGLEGYLKVVFIPIKKEIDTYESRYEEVCKRNKENGKLGGRPKKEETQNNRTVLEESERVEKNPTSPIPIPIPIPNHNHNQLLNLELEIKNIVNSYSTNKIFNAKELQLDFNRYLTENGFSTRLEVKVDSNGSCDYCGFIDIVAEYKGKKLAIELDNTTPRGRSVYKLKNYDCNYRFILLRNNFRHYFIEDIEIIGLKKEPDLVTDDASLLVEITKQVVEYLNLKTNSKFRYKSKSTQSKINARLNEGYKLDDFIAVIDKKTDEWIDNPDFSKYLCPETLFGTKFEKYLNQKVVPKKKSSSSEQWDLLKGVYDGTIKID